MPDRYTVDELARAGGLPTSTIRLYRHRGLLPAPQMEGRVGYFDDGHLARLRLIGELRGRGFSLAAIKQLVDNWEAGRDLEAVLGVEQTLIASAPDLETMSRADVESRFPELVGKERLWHRLVDLEIVLPRSDDADVDVQAGFLRVAGALQSLGVPLPVMLDEFAAVWDFAGATGARFVALFEQYVLADATTVEPAALATMIAALRDAGVEVVAAALRTAIDRAAADAVAAYVDGVDHGSAVS